MAEQNPQMRPSSPAQAPDPATSYERAKPEKEAGMGRLDNNKFAPEDSKDKMEQAVKHKQDLRQINAEDVVNGRHGQPADGAAIRQDQPQQPDHSMQQEEPLGWDQAPTDIHNRQNQRQPKTDGKGGTP
jgi:hypothetical protein